MTETGFYMQALKQLGISPNAAIRGSATLRAEGEIPVEFNFDALSCRLVNVHRYQRPTVFATREEAGKKTEQFLARVRAVLRTPGAVTAHEVGQGIHRASVIGAAGTGLFRTSTWTPAG
jgi:hypothetical protein